MFETFNFKLITSTFQHEGFMYSFDRYYFFQYDSDGNSTIDFPEFIAFMAAKKKSFGENEASIRRAFRVLDKDCNGYITPRELREWVQKLGEKLTPKEANDLVNEADANGDGKISIDEFVALMVND